MKKTTTSRILALVISLVMIVTSFMAIPMNIQAAGALGEAAVTFHFYNGTGDFEVIPVAPSSALCQDALELINARVAGYSDAKNMAFWGWFTDAQLNGSGRTRDGLRRPTVGHEGFDTDTVITAELIDQLAVNGNINLYAVWVLWGDVYDSGLVSISSANRLSQYINMSHVAIVRQATKVTRGSTVTILDFTMLMRSLVNADIALGIPQMPTQEAMWQISNETGTQGTYVDVRVELTQNTIYGMGHTLLDVQFDPTVLGNPRLSPYLVLTPEQQAMYDELINAGMASANILAMFARDAGGNHGLKQMNLTGRRPSGSSDIFRLEWTPRQNNDGHWYTGLYAYIRFDILENAPTGLSPITFVHGGVAGMGGAFLAGSPIGVKGNPILVRENGSVFVGTPGQISGLVIGNIEGVVCQDTETITFAVPANQLDNGRFAGIINDFVANSDTLLFFAYGQEWSMQLGDTVGFHSGDRVFIAGGVQYSLVVVPVQTFDRIYRLIIDNFEGIIDQNAATITFNIPENRVDNGRFVGTINHFVAGNEMLFFFAYGQEWPMQRGDVVGFHSGDRVYVADGVEYTLVINTAHQFTVTFTRDLHGGGHFGYCPYVTSLTVALNYGDVITTDMIPTVVPNWGMRFDSWSVVDDNGNWAAPAVETPEGHVVTADIIFFAGFCVVTDPLYFHASENGGALLDWWGNRVNKMTIMVPLGASPNPWDIPTPIPDEGWKFTGWYPFDPIYHIVGFSPFDFTAIFASIE